MQEAMLIFRLDCYFEQYKLYSIEDKIMYIESGNKQLIKSSNTRLGSPNKKTFTIFISTHNLMLAEQVKCQS